MINLMLVKKIYSAFFIILVTVSVSFAVKSVFSQAESPTPPEQNNTQAAFSQVCLNMVDEEKNESKTKKSGSGNMLYFLKPGQDSANFTVSGAGFDPGAKVYPFLCVLKGSYVAYQGGRLSDEPVCSTGNYETDKKLFCKPGENCPDNTNSINDFTLNGVSQEGTFTADANGSLTISGVLDKPQAHVQYIWYGGYFKGESMGTGGVTEVPTGANNTEQLGTFPLEKINATAENVKQKCVTVHWDPYGRVFDSQSLEPMTDIGVRLLTSLKPETKYNLIRGENPTTTTPDGVFNFIVPQGIYYLRLSNLPLTHQFVDTPNLNTLFLDIYHKKKDGTSSLYLPDQPINELIDTPEEQAKNEPDLEERDIALDPGSNKPYIAPIISINSFQSSNDYYTTYFGKSSHPFPIVELVRSDNQQVVFKQEFTDDEARYGYWQTNIVNDKIPSDTPLMLILKKNPKYFTDTSPDTSVESGKVLFEPIIRRLQGYLKDDATGQPMVDSRVAVVVSATNSVYATVKTDKNGFFELPAKQLPFLPYKLRVTPVGSAVSLTKSVSNFIKDNKVYLEEKKINPMIADEKEFKAFVTETAKNAQKTAEQKEEKSTAKGLGKILLTVMVLGALVIAAAFTFLAFYIKNKQPPTV